MTTGEKVNLTPNPKILRLLGEINFQNWQCIAELIDNSIDAFLREWDGDSEKRGEIRVQIPNRAEYNQGQPIVIWDNAVGMTREQLENALRAGFSGNDPISNLGLFGMGFISQQQG